ncbi:MAG TPA: hypothetical protein VFM54_06665 [Micromonosporaceae bacterium]|nr:hypothetical protein [Micromonosporaceae bacterium]
MVADDRAAYLPELAGLLWPGDREAAYTVVPSAARPRLLVPAGAPRAAAAAVRFSVEAVTPRARLRRRLLATVFRLGTGGLVCRDRLAVRRGTAGPTGLDTHLAQVLGRPVLLSVQIGPPRANRKPVLAVLARDGAVLGFAKLGVNALTRTLVDGEAAALRRLAGVDCGPLAVPAVRHHGGWGPHTLLVQAPLPVWLPRAGAGAAQRAERAAMVALTGCLGVRRVAHSDSGFAKRLAMAVEDLPAGPVASRLAAALDTVAGRGDELPFGCWHGDWNGGNSAVLTDGRVLVWDWERFDPDVPAGFDALHLALQAAVTRGGVPPAQAARALFARGGELLAPFGVPEQAVDLVVRLYLVELGARYLRDRQAEAGARLGRIDEWLLPVLAERVEGRGR